MAAAVASLHAEGETLVANDAALPEQGDIEPAVRAAVEHLLSNAQTPAGVFAQRYWPYVHDHPQIAMAHGAVRQALSAFPPAPPDTSTMLQERHRLAEKARHLAKRK